MPLQVVDANGTQQGLPQWVDNVYRFAGSITAAQGASAGKDILLITGAPSGTVTRLLKAKFSLVGGGTAGLAGGNGLTMNRVTAAPTGQTNVAVTGNPHKVGATTIGSTCAITPSTTQTAGTSPLVLGATVVSMSLNGTANDLFQKVDAEIPCGPESAQQPIVIPAAGFLTIRNVAALPANSVLYFDLMISEATS